MSAETTPATPIKAMTPDQAMQNIFQVISNFRGTLQEHEVLQKSFRVVAELVKPHLSAAQNGKSQPAQGA
jgi:hypothetical protein